MGDRVLVDTSAWIEFFRKGDSHVAGVVDQLLHNDLIAIPGVVRAEILQGARQHKEYDSLAKLIDALPRLNDPDDLWEQVSQLGFALRLKGLGGLGIPDLIIAVHARHHEARVLTLDRHFRAMADVVPLELLA
ncbi:PIN domain-containing protein [Planctomycetota bacterium]